MSLQLLCQKTLEHCFDVKHLGVYTIHYRGYSDETMSVCNILSSQTDSGELYNAAGEV